MSNKEAGVKIQIDGLELLEIKKYANKFYSYRACTVWSAPEVLSKPKLL